MIAFSYIQVNDKFNKDDQTITLPFHLHEWRVLSSQECMFFYSK